MKKTLITAVTVIIIASLAFLPSCNSYQSGDGDDAKVESQEGGNDAASTDDALVADSEDHTCTDKCTEGTHTCGEHCGCGDGCVCTVEATCSAACKIKKS